MVEQEEEKDQEGPCVDLEVGIHPLKYKKFNMLKHF